jgi:adenine C2-methylase RlmN of 23S rRNA A2503 and tRNA A37
MEKILKQLQDAGYDYAVAVATQAEIDAGAACGQLSIISEK